MGIDIEGCMNIWPDLRADDRFSSEHRTTAAKNENCCGYILVTRYSEHARGWYFHGMNWE